MWNLKFNERGGLVIPDGTVINNGSVIPAFSEIGNGCKLGDCCTLGNNCKLGDRCTLGNGCKLENLTVSRFMTMANVDGTGRQILLIVDTDGNNWVRAGCFFGSCDEFVDKASSEGKNIYSSVVPAVFGALKEKSK